MEAVEYTGQWWEAGTIGETVPGTLTFTPGQRPTLKLIGTFKNIDQLFQATDVPMIHGVSTKGDPITLYRCSEVTTEFSAMITSIYNARMALVGRHFEQANDIAFPVIDVHFTNLDDFTLLHGFTVSHDNSDMPNWFGVRYDYPKKIAVTVGDYQITVTHGFNLQQRGISEWNLRQTPLLRIASATPVLLEELLQGPLRVLQNLVAFATGVPVYPTRIEAYTVPPPTRERIVNVIFNVGDHPAAKQLLVPEMLFTLPDLGEDFPNTLRNWFACHETIPSVLDLYFSTLYGARTTHQHHQFLSLAQALESYHRQVYGGRLMSSADFKCLRDALTVAVPQSLTDILRDKIIGKFNFLNEVTLAERLEKLLDEAPPMILARAIPDREEFAASIRRTRNYLTHYDPALRERATNDEDLLNLTDRMGWLLAGLLMKRIGLSDAKIDALLQRNERLKHAGTWRIV
jgi:hypothetical protein